MLQENHSDSSRHKSIGFFVDSLNFGYQISVWHGVMDGAKKRNINLYCFTGDIINTPTYFNAKRNVIYELVNKKRIHGLLVLTGTLGTYIGLEEMTKFCKKYDLPVVSIGLSLEGIPSIVLDNYQGMYDVVSHLVTTHHYRNIAFLHKQEDHQEGKERFQAYKDVLADNHIPFNPDLVVPGKYYARPVEQVSLLLDEQKVNVEAIVAIDDYTAIPVIKVLHDRGINVPDDIAIVGFDDTTDSKYLHLPLTTVKQPLYEQGQKSIEMICDILAEKKSPEKVHMPASLIIRQSCGCISKAIITATVSGLSDVPMEIIDILTDKYNDIATQMIETVKETHENIDISLIHSLLDAFIKEVKGNFDGSFIAFLDKVTRQVVLHGGDVSAWHRIISVLYKNILPNVHKDKNLLHFENIWQQCHIMISEVAQRSLGFIRLETERQSRIIRNINYEQVTAFTLDELTDVIAAELPKIGITSGYLSLYNDDDAPSQLSTMIMAYDESGRIDKKDKKVKFLSTNLVPDGFLPAHRQYTMIVAPLNIRKDLLGFVLFEVGPTDGTVYEKLHVQLSITLKQVLLLDESRRDKETMAQYAGELKRSNLELQQFAYMASHDLQEPLRMISNYLRLIEKRYIADLDNAAHEFMDFAIDGANRMSNLINDLLMYSRVGTRKKPFKKTDSGVILNQVIINLKMAIEESGAVIIKDTLPNVWADETQLMQLFQNLIGNAIKFRGKENPRIEVKVKRKENKWLFSVKDNGIGIDPQFDKRIFLIFQRLHSRNDYSGTGIGLAMCKKIVERHGGEIWLDPCSKDGARFNFTLPACD